MASVAILKKNWKAKSCQKLDAFPQGFHSCGVCGWKVWFHDAFEWESLCWWLFPESVAVQKWFSYHCTGEGFSASTLLVWRPVKSWVIRWWSGYLSRARRKLSAYGPADETAKPSSRASVKSRIVIVLVLAYQIVLETNILYFGPLSGTTLVSQYQKKHSPTHTYPNHQSPFICFIHLFVCLRFSIVVYLALYCVAASYPC